MTTTSRIRAILTDLERVRENLLALSDDIWLSIDHNDSKAVKRGAEFKLAYNEKMAAFDHVASELSALVQQHTAVQLEPTTSNEAAPKNAAANERLIKELDKEEAHSLTEDFRYKRPYGFVLQRRAFKDIVTWRHVLELVCRVLHEKDPKRFSALPDNPDFISTHGKSYFARKPDLVRSPSKVAPNVYAEVNLSANNIRDRICELLKTFEIPENEMTIYLRQDRDAE